MPKVKNALKFKGKITFYLNSINYSNNVNILVVG